MANRLEDAAQQVPNERSAGVAQRQGAGGIGADELDVHRPGMLDRDSPVSGSRPEDRPNLRGDPTRLEADIDEARRRDFGGAHRLRKLQLGDERLGDAHRRHACHRRELHRRVGGVVPVLSPRRTLDAHRREWRLVRGKDARNHRVGSSALHRGAQGIADAVHERRILAPFPNSTA